MSRHLNAILVALLGITFLLVVALTGITYREKEITTGIADQLEQNQQVIMMLHELQFLTNTIQLESNSYVLTGDAVFLVPYIKARNDIPAKAKELAAISFVRPGHSRMIDTIISNSNRLVSSSDKYIKLRQQGKFHAGLFRGKIEESQQVRRAIVNLPNQVIVETSEALHATRIKNNVSNRVLDSTFLKLVVTIFVLLSITFSLVYYSSKKRKISEAKLRRSEQQFVSFFNLSPVPTSITEASSGKILFINDAYEKLLSVERAETIGKTEYDLGIISPEDRKNISDEITENDGILLNVEMKLKTRLGETKYIYGSFDTIYIDETKCYLGCMIDVTEKKASERKLVESEQRFNIITKMNPVPTFISEIDTGKFVYINDAFSSFIGLPSADVIGKTSWDLNLFEREYREQIAKTILDNGYKADKLEMKINAKDELKDILLSADVINIDGRRCFIGTTFDISERKKTEQALMDAYVKEKELSAVKSNFVTIASHEFRTPLTTILSSASLLEMYKTTEQQEDRLRHTKRIKASSSNLIVILDELLSLDKIESGSVMPGVRKFDIEEFMHILCTELRYTAKKGQEIGYRHSGEKMVMTDSTFIRHIVSSLVSNALKYSPEGRAVQVYTSFDGKKLTISVKDQGIGISTEDQKNLFRRFFRASNAGTIPGTGLGLHIAKRYIDLLGGAIRVKSTIGVGTEVTVEL